MEKFIGKLTDNPSLEEVWDAICAMQNKTFHTSKGLAYTYTVRGYEIFVDRKVKSITRSSVEIALVKAMELERIVTGPKKLTVFGASYLYPIFLELGLAINPKYSKQETIEL